jgi:hypothetical protein
VVASDAARSLNDSASLEWMLQLSLLALFRFSLPVDCRPDTDVAFVVVDSAPESRELDVVVGVPVYVVDDAEVRFGVKLERALPDFLGGFSGPEEPVWLSSAPLSAGTDGSLGTCSLSLAPMLSLDRALPLLRTFTESTPSHCVPILLGGVGGRLTLPARRRLPTLALARAVFPLRPSSFLSASAVASSSIPDHPSWLPRRRAWATLGEGCGWAWATLGEGCGRAWATLGEGCGRAWATLGEGCGRAWATLGEGCGCAWARSWEEVGRREGGWA